MPTVADYRVAAPFSLKELVDATNSILRARPEIRVSRRTVRFYIQEGVFPPPIGAPKCAKATYQHLLRLVLVRLMLAEGLRLELIRSQLNAAFQGGTEQAESAVEQLLESKREPHEQSYEVLAVGNLSLRAFHFLSSCSTGDQGTGSRLRALASFGLGA